MFPDQNNQGDLVVAEVVEVAEPPRVEHQPGALPAAHVGDFAVEDAVVADVVGAVDPAFELGQSIFDQRQTRAAAIAGEVVESGAASRGEATGESFLTGAEDGHGERACGFHGLGGAGAVGQRDEQDPQW